MQQPSYCLLIKPFIRYCVHCVFSDRRSDHRIVPFCLFAFGLYPDPIPDRYRFSVMIDMYENQISVIDRKMIACFKLLYKGIDSHFDRCVADIGDAAFQYNDLIQRCAVLKHKLIDRAGGDQSAAVPHSRQRGCFIDPFHQPAAEQPVLTVDIFCLNDLSILCGRIEATHIGCEYGEYC